MPPKVPYHLQLQTTLIITIVAIKHTSPTTPDNTDITALPPKLYTAVIQLHTTLIHCYFYKNTLESYTVLINAQSLIRTIVYAAAASNYTDTFAVSL